MSALVFTTLLTKLALLQRMSRGLAFLDELVVFQAMHGVPVKGGRFAVAEGALTTVVDMADLFDGMEIAFAPVRGGRVAAFFAVGGCLSVLVRLAGRLRSGDVTGWAMDMASALRL